MPQCRRVVPVLLACAMLAAPGAARAQRATPTFDLHGFVELQARTYGDDFHPENFVPSQWAHVLNLEIESDLAPEGLGFIEVLSAFARIEVRYDCIYNGCGVAPTDIWWGRDARRAPRNLTTGREYPYTGAIRAGPNDRLHRGNRLGDFSVGLSALRGVIEISPMLSPTHPRCPGLTAAECTFQPVDDALFAVKSIDASVGKAQFAMGPWNLDAKIDEVGALSIVPNQTDPLPLRPAVPLPGSSADPTAPQGLYIPSFGFRRIYDQLDDPEQSFSQKDLSWNHGQGQDERELKELYLDIESFEGRLWIRAGKQSIVWGKTELFRTTDQFNPQDLALSSLPSLEESRLSLWSVRGTWSFYDVGPLEDVRLEVAVNLDDFEPLDLGRCGEPYTVWLVCAKTFGLWAHGLAGSGIAGEIRPPKPWDKDSGLEGLEFGARVEWRWRRFSFQISDFYGYDDAPVIDFFWGYERKVDPLTGRPLDVRGNPLVPGMSADEVLLLHPGNRQLFDLACAATEAIAGPVIPELEGACLLDLLNSKETILGITTPAQALGLILGGSATGEFVASVIASGRAVDLVELNVDPNDGPGAPGSLSSYLTDQQEALLGCGAFYGTDCDADGIDLFNAEASVLLQSFPQFEPGGAVATRPFGGLPVILPGARGPDDDINRNGIPDLIDPEIPVELRYDPNVDGCVGPGLPGCAGAHDLLDPDTGQPFASEMAALSRNFFEMVLAIAASQAATTDPDCNPDEPLTCTLVRGVFNVAGATRPEVRAGGNGRFGRRDFAWHGGAEIVFRYERRNVLGFSFDFAEDVTKTNWSIEATWMKDQPYAVVDKLRGFDENDTYNLTISVDRPTFINFLNPNRTFFVNSQWFFRWIDDYRDGGYVAHGPLSVLGTFTVATGYHQDRLLPSLTWVHDVRSTSGGVIGQVTYRFTTSLSATVGVAAFYGEPEPIPVAIRQPVPTNLGGQYRAHTRYNGLTPIAERDEFYLLVRYTF